MERLPPGHERWGCCEELPDDLGRVQRRGLRVGVQELLGQSTLGVAPDHWPPAPAIVMSSTVRLSGQLAVEVVTTPTRKVRLLPPTEMGWLEEPTREACPRAGPPGPPAPPLRP